VRALMQGAWRLVPMPVRRRLLDRYGRLTMPPLAADGGRADGTATVVGPLSVFSGVGEGARLCHQALRSLGIPVSLIDVTSTFQPVDAAYAPAGAPTVPRGSLIVHLNPPHFAVGLAALGRAVVAHRKVIGYWAWELPAIPPWWRGSLAHVHEIWTPSRFVADAIRAAGVRRCPPITVVPHPVAVPVPAAVGRARFALDDRAFVVLVVFHMGSGFERKNPLAAVRAFRRAFGDDPAAQLVLAVKDPGDDPVSERRLLEAVAAADNVRLVTEKWTREEMNALIAASDVVLSLHRAEGFGLVLGEAMLLGKATVATGWSGNVDFMTPENACLVDSTPVAVVDRTGPYAGAATTWAEPDEAHAAGLLRALYEDAAMRQALGARARRDATAFFGLERYRERIASSLGL
jgi:glycosyltransferase involved in cell wall biosynthesis